MSVGGDLDRPRWAAMASALAPYPWRQFTARMLARRALGAADRQSVVELLSAMGGACVGSHGQIEPADVRDVRVAVLEEMLERRCWRALALDSLCQQMLQVLDAWLLDRDQLDTGLRQLLDDR